MKVHSPMTWWMGMARLASILAGVGLVTTRLGLVAHELVGHGGTALAWGGRIEHVKLFWFAGGWIDYELPRSPDLTARISVSLGGIALELVVGLAMWFLLARRKTFAGRLARATGAAIAIHAAWYLAVGTYHGFGDGAIVRYAAGDGRYAIAIGAGAVVLALAFFTTRSVLGMLAATIPGERRAQIAGVLVAALLAGGVQAALAIGEVQLRRDRTYGAVMKPERERVVARELANWERQQHGAVDEAARRAREAELAAQHRELPFGIILGALVVLASLAGAWRSRPAGVELPPRLAAKLAALAVGSVALVIAIDAAFA